MTQTGQPCALPLAPCCAGPPFESMWMLPVTASRNCGSCAPPPATRRHWPSQCQGWWPTHAYQGRVREASQLASEAWTLIESIGDPTLTVGLSFAPIYAKMESAEWCDMLRWSQRVIDLADGDPPKGNFIFGSPLALALTTRAVGRYCLGRPGWRDDLRHGLAMARSADPADLRRGRHLRLRHDNTDRSAEARRFRDARDRGCPTHCRTIR